MQVNLITRYVFSFTSILCLWCGNRLYKSVYKFETKKLCTINASAFFTGLCSSLQEPIVDFTMEIQTWQKTTKLTKYYFTYFFTYFFFEWRMTHHAVGVKMLFNKQVRSESKRISNHQFVFVFFHACTRTPSLTV